MTGAICEQIVMTPGHLGFNPSDVGADASGELPDHSSADDPFWRRLRRYDEDGCLMGCSIQPAPKSKNKGAEAKAPQGEAAGPPQQPSLALCPVGSFADFCPSPRAGLFQRHAYGLSAAREVDLGGGKVVRMVRVRNPWGMREWVRGLHYPLPVAIWLCEALLGGECDPCWASPVSQTGKWSDTSPERKQHDAAIRKAFGVKKTGTAGATQLLLDEDKRLTEYKEAEGEEEAAVGIDRNDGYFHMSYEDFRAHYTHFFVARDFPDQWRGYRVRARHTRTLSPSRVALRVPVVV